MFEEKFIKILFFLVYVLTLAFAFKYKDPGWLFEEHMDIVFI